MTRIFNFVTGVPMSLLSQTDPANNPGDKYSFGDSMMLLLIATLMIFAILAVLMGVLYLFKLLSIAEKRNAEKQKQAAEIAGGTMPTMPDEEGEDELVAAVTAAISVYMEDKSDDISAPFVIKKIKRIN